MNDRREFLKSAVGLTGIAIAPVTNLSEITPQRPTYTAEQVRQFNNVYSFAIDISPYEIDNDRHGILSRYHWHDPSQENSWDGPMKNPLDYFRDKLKGAERVPEDLRDEKFTRGLELLREAVPVMEEYERVVPPEQRYTASWQGVHHFYHYYVDRNNQGGKKSKSKYPDPKIIHNPGNVYKREIEHWRKLLESWGK